MDDKFWKVLREKVEKNIAWGFDEEQQGYIVNFGMLTDIISDEARRDIKIELVRIVRDKETAEKESQEA